VPDLRASETWPTAPARHDPRHRPLALRRSPKRRLPHAPLRPRVRRTPRHDAGGLGRAHRAAPSGARRTPESDSIRRAGARAAGLLFLALPSPGGGATIRCRRASGAGHPRASRNPSRGSRDHPVRAHDAPVVHQACWPTTATRPARRRSSDDSRSRPRSDWDRFTDLMVTDYGGCSRHLSTSATAPRPSDQSCVLARDRHAILRSR
jgi:hypothetical protein